MKFEDKTTKLLEISYPDAEISFCCWRKRRRDFKNRPRWPAGGFFSLTYCWMSAVKA